MLKKESVNRKNVEIFCVDAFVPEDHILRKIERALDFSKIYDIVGELYCTDNGRPSIDPVVLFKMVIIQHLFGIVSLRKTVKEIEMNVAYRWFLGYSMQDKIPHFATVSYNFKHRFTEDVIENVFNWILFEIHRSGYLSPEAVFIDGTHIKADANIKKYVKKKIPVAAKIYEKQLMEEINEDRENHDKKPFNGGKKEQEKEVIESTSDPDCGVFHKGEHKKQFAYEAHTACDENGYVLGCVVTPGNIHDSVAFNPLYDIVTEKFSEIKEVVADAAYKTAWICKKIIDDGRIPVMPYKRPMGGEGFFRPYEYVYDEYYDCVICPNNQVLNYSTTNKEGYREYKSNPQKCESCPHLAQCTNSKNHQKVVTKHIWADYLELTEDYRHTFGYKAIYEKRKETIERVFADAKEKHAMRYTTLTSLAQVTKWVKLKFACMNLKKFALHLKKKGRFSAVFMLIYEFYESFILNMQKINPAFV